MKEIVLIADMLIGMIQRMENHIAKVDTADITDHRIEMDVFIIAKIIK